MLRSVPAIAVAQTCPVAGDVPANVEEHLHLAALAAVEGARVLLFPELSLTGYELDLADALAFTEGDPRLLPLRDAAARHGMTLVVGAPVRLDSGLHIGALILSSDRTVDVYTKHNLGAFSPTVSPTGVIPPAEATVFEPGTRNPLLALDGMVAGLAVCADVGLSAHAEAAARRGAAAYLAGMFVIPAEFDGEADRLRDYAVRHGFTVAMANYGGPSGGLEAAGRSTIWSPKGEILAQVSPIGAGVAIACRESPPARGSLPAEPGVA